MLILSRKLHEGVVISGPCRVSVVELRRDKVRLGFEGAGDVVFLRDEVPYAPGEPTALGVFQKERQGK